MLFLLGNMAVAAPEDIAERHFFLEELVNPYAIWGIRGICIVAGITALIIYFYMKNKKGE